MNNSVSKKNTNFLDNNYYDTIVSSGKQLKLNNQRKEIKRLLETQFKESNGQLCNVFAVIETEGFQIYSCILCQRDGMYASQFINHTKSKSHKDVVRAVSEKSLSTILNAAQKSNGEVQSEFQTQLNQVKDQAVVGVEYIIEVYIGATFQSNYNCVLCEGNLSDSQTVQVHLTSYAHRLKYLEKHFPTAFKEISAMKKRELKYSSLEKVCANIEDLYGRLSLSVVRSDEFFIDRMKFYEDIVNGSHFDEKMGRTFAEIFDDKNDGSRQSPFSDELSATCSLKSVSSCGECNKGPYNAMLRASPFGADDQWKASSKSPERSPKYNRGEKFRAHKNPFRQSPGQSTRNEYTQRQEKFSPKFKNTNRIQPSTSQYPYRDRSRSPQRSRRDFSPEYRKSKNYNRSPRQRKSSPQQTRRHVGRGGSHSRPTFQNRSSERLNAADQNRLSNQRYEKAEPCSSRMAYQFHHNGKIQTASDKESYKRYSPMQTASDSDIDKDPITIISVLSVLSAFENLFGSFGPKMIDMMAEAIAMEKFSVNSSNRLLDNNDHCTVFKIVKEKLRGFLQVDLVKSNKRTTIEKTIRNMEMLINEAQARKNLSLKVLSESENHSTKSYDRSAIAARLLSNLREQGRGNISESCLAQLVDEYIVLANAKQCHLEYDIHELKFSAPRPVEKLEPVQDENIVILLDTDDEDEINNPEPTASTSKIFPTKLEKPMYGPATTEVASTSRMFPTKLEEPMNNSATIASMPTKLEEQTILTDSNLRTLIKNFSILSDAEKHDVIVNVKELKTSDPQRIERLKMEMKVDQILLLNDILSSKMQGAQDVIVI